MQQGWFAIAGFYRVRAGWVGSLCKAIWHLNKKLMCMHVCIAVGNTTERNGLSHLTGLNNKVSNVSHDRSNWKKKPKTCLLGASQVPLDIHEWKIHSGYRNLSCAATWSVFVCFQQYSVSFMFQLSLAPSLWSEIITIKPPRKNDTFKSESCHRHSVFTPHIIIASTTLVLIIHLCQQETFGTQFMACLRREWITPFFLFFFLLYPTLFTVVFKIIAAQHHCFC